MKYDPEIHHRRSIRLKGYDYSSSGNYFITICVQEKEHLFGKIQDNKMFLNDAGLMIKKWYLKLGEKFPDIKCGEYIVMPNHFHAIITNVGADPRVCPSSEEGEQRIVGADPCVCPSSKDPCVCPSSKDPCVCPSSKDPQVCLSSKEGEHMGSPLRNVVQWFKTMTTNEYIHGVKKLSWKPFNGKLWQRNYYEHIIRSEESYSQIVEYIANNPSSWGKNILYVSLDGTFVNFK